MAPLLYALCAATGWAAFGYMLRLQRRQPSQARRAICVAFGAFAGGVTLAVAPVATALDQLTGLPNLAKVISHGCALTIAAAAQNMLLHLTRPTQRAAERSRRWIVATGVAFALMVALFGYTLGYDTPVRLTVEYAADPAVTAYLLVFMVMGFLAYCVDIARLCWRFARICGRPWLRRGLRTTAVGAVFALLYAANKIGYLTAHRAGLRPQGEEQIAAVLVTVSALLMITGLTMPAWGPLLDLSRRWADLRAWRQLGPLWRDLVRALPELELDDSLRRPTTALRDLDYALTRRVAEIRDARLALRPYLETGVTGTAEELAGAAGLTGADRRAVVEAAQLAAALRAHRAGTPARDPQPADDLHRPAGGYAGEVAWLGQVAEAYLRSPLVPRTLAALDPAGPTPVGEATR